MKIEIHMAKRQNMLSERKYTGKLTNPYGETY